MGSEPLHALASGEWWDFHYPFRHFRATNVLAKDHFQAQASAFNKIVETTAGKCPGEYRLVRSTANYDALMLAITDPVARMFFPFFSETWIRSLYEMFGLPYLPRIDAALHSSPKNSRTGWIHTDYCSAWFDESGQSDGEILFPNRSRCQYFDGQVKAADAKPVEYVRAATLIFYLCNDGWQTGDGGETALYAAAREGANTTTDLVRPFNNTLLFFECSPHSYHRFVTNPGRARNSLILWLHSTVEYAESRWGTAGINRRATK